MRLIAQTFTDFVSKNGDTQILVVVQICFGAEGSGHCKSMVIFLNMVSVSSDFKLSFCF